ncbi:MAG TPA: PaaI family thioesterase [Jiangellaceae bacterium]
MTQTQAVRSRTFSWHDPSTSAALLGSRSGLELLQAMIEGEIPSPPVMEMVGVDGFTVELGRVTIHLTPHEFHYNPLGTVHGGVLATLLDTATGCAVHSTLPAGIGYTSVDLTTKFLRQVTVDTGPLRCEGVVLSAGRRTALAEARLTDGQGRLLAHATSTCMLFGTSER